MNEQPRFPKKYVTCEQMWGGWIRVLPRVLIWPVPESRGKPSCPSRCRTSRHHRKREREPAAAPHHCCTIARAFPPSQAIAEGIFLRHRLPTGGLASAQLPWCFSRGAVGAKVPALTQASRPGMCAAAHEPMAAGFACKWRGSGVYNSVGSAFDRALWYRVELSGRKAARLVSWSLEDGGTWTYFM